jgi:hypothetical protein
MTFADYLELLSTQENFNQTPEVAAGILAPIKKDFSAAPRQRCSASSMPFSCGHFRTQKPDRLVQFYLTDH